jgi:hypothetical protein
MTIQENSDSSYGYREVTDTSGIESDNEANVKDVEREKERREAREEAEKEHEAEYNLE